MAGVLGSLWLMSHNAITQWTSFFRKVLESAASGSIESNGPVIAWSTLEVFRWIVPVLSSALFLSVAAGLAQGGLSFAPEALELKFDRFNPASKLGQIFSPVGLSNLLKSLLPFAAIAWIGWSDIHEHWLAITHASYLNFRLFAAMVAEMTFEVTWKAGLVMLAWSGIDYLLTWQKMEGDLKMSKEEVREEHKSTDGNPLIKGTHSPSAATDAQEAGDGRYCNCNGGHYKPYSLCGCPALRSRYGRTHSGCKRPEPACAANQAAGHRERHHAS